MQLSFFYDFWRSDCICVASYWRYRKLFGTDYQFGNFCTLHRLSVHKNMVIAMFGTEYVKKVKYNNNTKVRAMPNRCSK
jgi:hypothetical protein